MNISFLNVEKYEMFLNLVIKLSITTAGGAGEGFFVYGRIYETEV